MLPQGEYTNFEMFISEHLRPDQGSKAGSWTRCRADQVVKPDLYGWFILIIFGIKRVCGKAMWPGSNALKVTLEV